MAVSLPAFAQTTPLWVTGDYETIPWTGAGNVMTETFGGSGIWQATVNMGTGRHEFKITQGNWSWNRPGSGDSWTYTDGSGNVTITYDLNTYADGWSSSSGRIGSNIDPGAWTAVGDWQGWSNNNGLTAMTGIGGGIYELAYVIASPGTYQYKAVNTGSWDAIGSDARGVNANTLNFTTTNPNETMYFFVNAQNGTIKVDTIPEPSTIALVGTALAAGLLRMRRRS